MIFPEKASHKTFRRTFELTAEMRKAGTVLAEESGVFRCEIRKIGSEPELITFERRQNYSCRLPGADDLAIEAVLFLQSELHPEWNSLRIGIPLSEVSDLKTFTVEYTGAKFLLRSGRQVLDEEYPFGDPPGDVSGDAFQPEEQPESIVRNVPLLRTASPGCRSFEMCTCLRKKWKSASGFHFRKEFSLL